MAARKSSSTRGGMFRNRTLLAVETLLVMGVVKDWLTNEVRSADLPNWGKVLFVMAVTVGLFGGVFLALEKLTGKGVAGVQSVIQRRMGMPTLALHGLVLFLLFLLYARMQHLAVFR